MRTAWLPTLVVALILGSFFRFRGLDYPVAYGPDQEPNVRLGLAVAAGDLNPHFAVYPGLGIYPLAAINRMVALRSPFPDPSMLDLPRGLALTNFQPAAQVLRPYYLADRGYTALTGVAIIFLTFVMGSLAFSRSVGALAALLIALDDGHVLNSHFATGDIPAAFWTAVAAVAALSVTRRPSLSRFLAAGAAAGCALATKFQAGPALVLPLTAALIARRADLQVGRPLLGGPKGPPYKNPYLLVLLGAALAFVVTSPYTLLDARQTMGDLSHEIALNAKGHYGFDLEPAGFLYSPFDYVFGALVPFAMGAPAAIVGMVGIGAALARRTRSDIVWLPFVVIFLGLLSIAPVVFVRYVLPVVPLLAVFAARALSRAMESRQRIAAWAAAALTLGVVGYSFLYTWTSSARFANDTRLQAERAMSSVVPDGKSIAIPAFANYLPSIDANRYRIVPCLAGTHDPQALVACGADYLIESGMFSNRADRDPNRYTTAYAGWHALRDGQLGYVPVAEFRATYLNEAVYAKLDPMFEGYFLSPTIRIYRRMN